jgi:hypothetical protein
LGSDSLYRFSWLEVLSSLVSGAPGALVSAKPIRRGPVLDENVRLPHVPGTGLGGHHQAAAACGVTEGPQQLKQRLAKR